MHNILSIRRGFATSAKSSGVNSKSVIDDLLNTESSRNLSRMLCLRLAFYAN